MTKMQLVKPVCRKRGCPLLGEVHPRCNGHSKRSGKPCGLAPIKGGYVCRMHGGKSGVVVEAAKRREALSAIGKLVAFDPDDQEPIETGLLREVRWSSQVAQAYGEAVAALDTDDLTQSGKDSRRLNVLVEAWTNERALHAKLAKTALDAGIAKRSVELAEQQASQIVQVIVNVLVAPGLGLSAEQIVMGKQVAAEVLRTLPRD